MTFDMNIEIIDNLLGGYILKSEEAAEINTFNDLCKFVTVMRNVENREVMILWSTEEGINQSIIDKVEKDIKSRPDLFIM